MSDARLISTQSTRVTLYKKDQTMLYLNKNKYDRTKRRGYNEMKSSSKSQ